MEGSKSSCTIAPKPAELVARARALIPVLARRSLEQKQRRGILPETIAEMQAAGFFRVLQPRRWGGYEMDLGTFYDIEMTLGEGDMSSGWTYGVLGVVSWFLGVMDDRAAQEVWSHDTTTLICSSTMPAGKATALDGGFRLAGNWRYASGCEHCGWALLGGMVHEESVSPDWRFFLVPRRDYRTVDSLAGRRPSGHRQHRRAFSRTFSCPPIARSVYKTIFCSGAQDRREYIELVPAALRPDFCARVSTAGLGALQAMLAALIDLQPRPDFAGGRASAENPFLQFLCAETAAASTKCGARCIVMLRRCTTTRAAARHRRSNCGCNTSFNRAP